MGISIRTIRNRSEGRFRRGSVKWLNEKRIKGKIVNPPYVPYSQGYPFYKLFFGGRDWHSWYQSLQFRPESPQFDPGSAIIALGSDSYP